MRIPICLLVIAAVTLLPNIASTQDRDPLLSRVVVESERESALLTSINVEFIDLTVQDAFHLMGEALGNKINIVINPSAQAIRIPSIQLENTNVLIASELISNLVTDLQVECYMKGGFVPVYDCLQQYHEVMEYAETEEERAKAFAVFPNSNDFTPILLVRLATEVDMAGLPDRSFRIYPIGTIVDEQGIDIINIEDIATIIETAWEMMPDQHAASLKYHPETRLLICSGTTKHLDVVDDVIVALVGHGQYTQKDDGRIKTYQAQMQKNAEQFQALLEENKRLKERIRELESRVKDQ